MIRATFNLICLAGKSSFYILLLYNLHEPVIHQPEFLRAQMIINLEKILRERGKRSGVWKA